MKLLSKLAVTLAVAVGASLLPLGAQAAPTYVWQGKYFTTCRPQAWRLPASSDAPSSYTVNRTFNTYPRKVIVSTRGKKFNMGPAARMMSGTRNLSFYWSAEMRVKSTSRRNGRVYRYRGQYITRYRLAKNIYVIYGCKGVRR
jgi:hypothetical protein